MGYSPSDVFANMGCSLNDELDAVRKAQKKEAEQLKNHSEKDWVLAGLAKSKYSLLKNEYSLNDKQKEKLKSVKNVSPILSKTHALKEEFRDIFEVAQSWEDGVLKLLDWIMMHSCTFLKVLGR